ncbi:MAG: RecX family transcriptional regulator [Candidatus Saccharibacteria bacterium]|nr:RecX family transcriptional regulator [Candidatus Saccharibacteria bacterium]
MEIYKLSDEIEKSTGARKGGGAGAKKSKRIATELRPMVENPERVVTELKQGVRNPERVNVYIDKKFAFSLGISQVVDFHLKIGKSLTDDELDELKKASEFGKLYQRTLEWVLMRPHSEKETRDYLYKKIYEKKLDREYIDLIIKKLKAKNYLNDEKFAEWWVENRFAKKGVSLKRLKMELMKKGINREVIERFLSESERNDRDEILKIIAKKRAKYPDDQKLIGYLVRQGFDYQTVKIIVEESKETED